MNLSWETMKNWSFYLLLLGRLLLNTNLNNFVWMLPARLIINLLNMMINICLLGFWPSLKVWMGANLLAGWEWTDSNWVWIVEIWAVMFGFKLTGYETSKGTKQMCIKQRTLHFVMNQNALRANLLRHSLILTICVFKDFMMFEL